MVFFHTEENDFSTNEVIQYFLYHGNSEFTRHNGSDYIDAFSLEITNEDDRLNYSAKGEDYELTADVNVFFRRGDMVFNGDYVKMIYEHEGVNKFIDLELTALRNYASISLHSRPGGFGSYYEEIFTNKLLQLNVAREAGLAIPASLITSQKRELLMFQEEHGQLIYKPISNHYTVKSNEISITPQGTQLATEEYIKHLPAKFFPTMFQEKINKKMEIRSFYFNNEFYSAAIFSQKNDKTRLDYRNYDNDHENRLVPFNLPEEIAGKLRQVYQNLKLDTGSADFIITTSNKYVFLEINALGQFSWISEACNFNLENKLAKFLCKN